MNLKSWWNKACESNMLPHVEMNLKKWIQSLKEIWYCCTILLYCSCNFVVLAVAVVVVVVVVVVVIVVVIVAVAVAVAVVVVVVVVVFVVVFVVVVVVIYWWAEVALINLFLHVY